MPANRHTSYRAKRAEAMAASKNPVIVLLRSRLWWFYSREVAEVLPGTQGEVLERLIALQDAGAIERRDYDGQSQWRLVR